MRLSYRLLLGPVSELYQCCNEKNFLTNTKAPLSRQNEKHFAFKTPIINYRIRQDFQRKTDQRTSPERPYSTSIKTSL
ncbi:hypothetical protein TcasGA2_TC003764 [Tribolium castaneum]|uniref:Uncharacterized protein n=1 Tax=Tribolium castaneum TaxID=7070 RepID=D6WEC5_TRICA|nr:hypothetical protein TcasGA2_TC003764 [Tribolium castaneum]